MSTQNSAQNASPPSGWKSAFMAFMDRRALIMLFLGFSAGIPILLIFSSLSLWLGEAGIEKSAVTFFSWAALGYSFKFVWAPLIDEIPVPYLTKKLGRRRAWLLIAQILIICAISIMAFSDPSLGQSYLYQMAVGAVLLGFSAATQDIVIDAYRIELAETEMQTVLASTYNAGYRIGMIVAGAGALFLAASLGTSKGNYIYHQCKTVQLNFPETTKINANINTFYKIPKTRKTAPYETVLEIARLIILNYAPNISSGTENMLALLFDMNKLWEEYILVRLKQFAEQKGVEVYGQSSKGFWNGMSIRPDIVLMKKDNQDEILIIDTKWKNIDYSEPSIHDLRQMYVYNEFWKSTKSLLLYPSPNTHLSIDKFITYDDNKHACSLGKISIFRDDELDINIGKEILKLIE